MPPLGAPKPPGGGGGKQINLGVPTSTPAVGAGMGAAPPMAIGAAPPAGGGGEGPQAPEEPSSQNMDYPELHIDGLGDDSGLDSLPDEGHARIHYKVTGKGKSSEKHGKNKGKSKHHATLEVHHITPEGDGQQKPSEGDQIRDKAKKFFESQDMAGGPEPMDSETPG